MKSYTDLEQSKRLAEILPFESADMMHDRLIVIPFNDGSLTPCWSLAALLDVLPSGKALIHDKVSHGYKCICKNIDSYLYDNPVDACVETIENLHKQKLL